MMYKHAELDHGTVNLTIVTGTFDNDAFYKPLRDTLTAKVMGIGDEQSTKNSVFSNASPVPEESTSAGGCNLSSSCDVLTAKYQDNEYRLQLAFSTQISYPVKLPSGETIRSKKADFEVRRTDGTPCPKQLLDDILEHFPDEEYEPLKEKPAD